MGEIEQYRLFSGGALRERPARLAALGALKEAMLRREGALAAALQADLGKCAFEAYATELGSVLHEISLAERKLKGWMRPRRLGGGIVNFPARGYTVAEPKGRVLVLAPWNYPVQLSLLPLATALAAGNVVTLALSEKSPASSRAVAELVAEAFPGGEAEACVAGPARCTELLAERWDHIFFTGSPRVGRIVAKAAAERLIPVTLELGGKSPCIVDATADLALSARRILWGKCLNAGQTCVAPDYLLVDRRVKADFLAALSRAFAELFPDGTASPSWGKLVDAAAYRRLAELVAGEQVLFAGGDFAEEEGKFPLLVVAASGDSPCMRQELFGPVLPLVEFATFEEARALVDRHPDPLALYVFSRDSRFIRRCLQIPFGGGCVNDTVSHIVSPLPFGGRGTSGLGAYHGERGFRELSHEKSVLVRGRREMAVKYPPYGARAERLMRKLWK